jgi:hypothetical protein
MNWQKKSSKKSHNSRRCLSNGDVIIASSTTDWTTSARATHRLGRQDLFYGIKERLLPNIDAAENRQRVK